MITTHDLLQSGEVLWMGEEEFIEFSEPKGSALPTEWEAKIGTHFLDAPFLAAIENVELLGPALVGLHAGDVILDTAYFGRLDLWERNYPYFQAALACRQNTVQHYEIAVSLDNVWSNNYFHWIIDTLPKLDLVRKYPVKPVLLLGQPPPRFVVEYLQAQELPYELVQTLRARVDTLLVPSTRRKEGVPYPSAIKFLKYLASDGYGGNPNFYITRRKADKRRVVNEAELLQEIERLGIELVELDGEPVSRQRARFASARTVLAPHGAGLANVVFGNPTVLELVNPRYTNPCCWMIGAAAGCDYRYLVCLNEGNEDLRVTPARVKELLDGSAVPTLY